MSIKNSRKIYYAAAAARANGKECHFSQCMLMHHNINKWLITIFLCAGCIKMHLTCVQRTEKFIEWEIVNELMFTENYK